MTQISPQRPLLIADLSRYDLEMLMKQMGEPGFRAKQLRHWTLKKRVSSFDEMTNIAKKSRERFNSVLHCEKMAVVKRLHAKKNDAIKFVFRTFHSHHQIESVLLFDGKRRSACLSSQVGCGLGCRFCATARMGFIRNCTAGEIIGQLIGINDFLEQHKDKLVGNVIFMGMGEALMNYENLRIALEAIMDDTGMGLGARRITISTAGYIPGIQRLLDDNFHVGLALSLNASDNSQRSSMMPINKKYPIESLVKIAREYYAKTSRRVTFEYIVDHGRNDTVREADKLMKMLGGFPCKINLIALNPHSVTGKRQTTDNHLLEFSDLLHERNLAATVRKNRGADICGACGQLGFGTGSGLESQNDILEGTV